ncbi:NADP-dependent oxidoreductase [Rhizobium ruizarguesonis]|jgi:NADPH:quinone reductase-like Zn-dependent oxidoreductase|uniref:NADP-dependent oxidoreductase n=1 Tax=Rhizobium ruizarguesonis TaxID=2081791 RepID=UPI000416AD33|nr:NADP-dependent oxidoreductase [Rhizobium ruizarguesonis]MBY5846077.1 NADP-dependent oxidoreductase [Rhizobium leguminosarum]NKL14809.1 alcohol dehydrogenase catalytic domain-containing protein [Rhizobium leguminosarum bv. viciae]MBY5883669.1 NADP-dependent oxidoreductase [Rhizobium leguminosarum]MBY5889865.1 NADP-dependent oxidoreductase [Rhizobium leguminosarum]NEH88882.1 alcohol dehydrogenase catalytic domain-containing protein [Rhizobium ruizarguesonis]
MKAALLKSYGDVDQFEIGDIPTPTPGPGEVLIKIEASAVNPFDLILRQGFMAKFIPLPLPAVLGGDAAGTISVLGDGVTGFAVGDRVVADFAANGKGAHAEYGVLPATSVAKLPAGLSFEEGASLVKAGLTGRQAVEALDVKAGDRVLVSGGLGTVGRSAIQYLRQIGAKPVAGVRPERLSEGRELAGEALDITLPAASPDFAYGISAAGPVAGNLIGNVRDGGTVASIVPVPEGANAGDRLTIHELFHRTDTATLDAVLDAAVRGLLVIPISHTFTLEEIGAAQNAVAAGAPGKVVLKH